MVKCPNCSKLTELKRFCSHCGKIVIPTNEERFEMLGEAVEKELRKELRNRKRKRLIRYMSISTLIFALLLIGFITWAATR
jgi:uncharacterized membrane protein YvbJ